MLSIVRIFVLKISKRTEKEAKSSSERTMKSERENDM